MYQLGNFDKMKKNMRVTVCTFFANERFYRKQTAPTDQK